MPIMAKKSSLNGHKSKQNILSICAILLIQLKTATSDINLSRVAQTNLSTISYDELHEFAVLDQIDHYRPPIKSLNTRQIESLDGVWDFCLDLEKQGFRWEWQNLKSLESACKEENFYKMPVPSAFNDIVSNATVKNYIGWSWYRTKIDLSRYYAAASSGEQQHFLQFDSANYLTLVWLKRPYQDWAKLIGTHVGGHLPFLLDISDFFQHHNDQNLSRQLDLASLELTLTVAVSNQLTKDTIPSGSEEDLSPIVGRDYKLFKPDFDFFHFAGIMGNVNLIRLPQTAHITQVESLNRDSDGFMKFRVCLNQRPPTSTSNDKAIKWLVYFDGRDLVEFNLVKFIGESMTAHEHVAGWFCQEIQLLIGEQFEQQQRGHNMRFAKLETIKFGIKLSSSPGKMWDDIYELKFSPTPPRLDLILDQTTKSNSIVDPVRVPLQGFGMHHEQLFSGRTMSLASIMKDLYLLKDLGANVLRTSHYPYSEAYLDACDTAGLMVIAECPAVGLNSFSSVKLKLHKQILLEMMQRDFHHPSILMWSIANEPQSQLTEARGYFGSLLDFARTNLARFTVDAKRPLTAAIAQSNQGDKIADLLDVVMINRYYGWYDYSGVVEAIRPALMRDMLGWAQRLPGKPLLMSEFGADTVEGLHSSTGQLFSEEYQRDLIVQYEKTFDELTVISRSNNGTKMNFIGSMIWNFADFSTHNSIGRVGGNRKGIFTRTREPKLAAEEVRRIYRSRLVDEK